MWGETISIAAVSKNKNLPVVNFSNSNPTVDYAGIGLNVTSFKPGGGFFTISGEYTYLIKRILFICQQCI